MPPAPPPPAGSAATLYLVDGYALAYRAFFAMIARPLTTRRGENTSAAWGVTNFLLRLLERRRPDYLAWVHDVGESFRHVTYPAYKATREKLTDELQQDFDRSVARIEQILGAFRVPVVGVEGFEADDVIGTLASAAAARGLQVVIVSGDKDFYQLIGPGVALLNPGRGGPAAVEEHWVDQSNASERLGVPPERVVDYLALVGDSSDNVPGVHGVGEKTALALLRTFGDLDAILAAPERITGKRAREAVQRDADLARLSRELVTIRRDVPLAVGWDELRVQPPNVARLTELFTELEFRSLIPKLAALDRPAPAVAPGPPAAAPAAPPAAVVVGGSAGAALVPAVADPTIVDDPALLAAVVAECRGAALVALDTETTSLDPMRADLVGLSLAIAPGRSWYLPFAHVAPDGELAGAAPRNLPPLASPALAPLREVLADPRVPKAGHNIKYDWLVLRRAGTELAGVSYDSMLASFVLDPGRRSHAIDELARDRLSLVLRTYGELVGRGRSERPFATLPVADAAGYCAADSEMVLRLEAAFRPELEDHELLRLLETIELPLIGVLTDMEWRGVRIDLERLGEIARAFARELAELERAIYHAAGTEFNINSTPQLRHVLFEKIQLPVQKKTKTGPSTDYPHELQSDRRGHGATLVLRPEPPEHPGAHPARRDDPPCLRRAARLAPPHGRLLPNRVASARPPLGRHRLRPGVRAGRRHPPPDRRDHLRRAPGAGDTRHAGARQDHQLRNDLRPGAIRLGAPARHLAGRRPRLHSGVLHPLRRRAGLARSHGCRGAAARLCRDPVRKAALHPGAQGSQLQHPRLR